MKQQPGGVEGDILFGWLMLGDFVSFQLFQLKVPLRISGCVDKTAFQELKLHIWKQKQEKQGRLTQKLPWLHFRTTFMFTYNNMGFHIVQHLSGHGHHYSLSKITN